jgi:hypothetical protein
MATHERRLSFATAPSGALCEAFYAVADDSQFWPARALWMMSCVVRGLCHRRDHCGLSLDVDMVRDHLHLPNVIELSKSAGLPRVVREPLGAYLRTLPLYDEDAATPAAEAWEQHGYLHRAALEYLDRAMGKAPAPIW